MFYLISVSHQGSELQGQCHKNIILLSILVEKTCICKYHKILFNEIAPGHIKMLI